MSAEPFRAGFAAIVGRPNVGKSTLLNALVGQKLSITSRKPQTTRHRISAVMTDAVSQCVFVDTPGFQTRHRNALTRSMNRTVSSALAGVDVVVLVLEACVFGEGDRALARLLPTDLPIVIALNKIDRLADKCVMLPFMEQVNQELAPAAIVPICAQRGTQLAALRNEIVARLPEGEAVYPEDCLTDRDERFFAAEFVREKLFRLLGDEVPYGTTVVVDSFRHEGPIRHVHATILVDRVAHKGMVIGGRGERLKRVASDARRDLELLYGARVHLEVWVKVKSGWADDERVLGQLGYG